MHQLTQPPRSFRATRRRFLQISALAGVGSLGVFGGSLVWANRAVRQFHNETIVPLTPWFVNTYLLRGNQSILVDTGFPTDETAIRAGLAANNVQPQDLALIFVTHGHYDHFGSAGILKSASNVPVSIHPSEADRLRTGDSPSVEALTTTGRIMRPLITSERSPAPVTPDILLNDSDRLDDFGVPARVIHTPGHTGGSLSLLVDGFAIIGDLMAGSLLYPNQPDYPFFIEDPTDQPRILTSLQRLLDEGAQVFFPGHGLPFDRAAAIRWLNSLSGGTSR